MPFSPHCLSGSMELNTADNNSRVIYSIAYKITKYHYSFIFTFLVKENTQANKEYDISGPFWVRFGKFTDSPPPPPYLNPCQYKCCSRLRDNVYFEIKVMSFRQTLLFLFCPFLWRRTIVLAYACEWHGHLSDRHNIRWTYATTTAGKYIIMHTK